jgi:protein-S-isoprenylcysteine O-methyltransferase Ste14
MSLYRWVIIGSWSVFVAYWAIAAVGAKRSAGGRRWGKEIGLRLVVVLLIVAATRFQALQHFIARSQHAANHSEVLGWIGAVLCLLGVGLAVNARRHLGRNWGLPMTRKEQPELVTGGPYAQIRHPIYTGLLLALLGSAIGVNVFLALLLVPVGAYFVYSARREEAEMLRTFPAKYPAYMAQTGMLTPRLFHRQSVF